MATGSCAWAVAGTPANPTAVAAPSAPNALNLLRLERRRRLVVLIPEFSP